MGYRYYYLWLTDEETKTQIKEFDQGRLGSKWKSWDLNWCHSNSKALTCISYRGRDKEGKWGLETAVAESDFFPNGLSLAEKTVFGVLSHHHSSD